MSENDHLLLDVRRIHGILAEFSAEIVCAHERDDRHLADRTETALRRFLERDGRALVRAIREWSAGTSPRFDERLNAIEGALVRTDAELSLVLSLRMELDAAAPDMLRHVGEREMARLATSAWSVAVLRHAFESLGGCQSELMTDGVESLWRAAAGQPGAPVPVWLPIVVPFVVEDDLPHALAEREDPLLVPGAVALAWLQETGRIPGLLAPLRLLVAARNQERRVLHAMMRATRPGALN